MPIGERAHTNRRRAESFGAAADEYDRVRPGYPDALFDDLTSDGPADALDVGCGTGKAARALAARGVHVLGVEVDERMASVARDHGIPVEIGTFEQWDPAGRIFDLVVSGQAWHWIDPVAGPAKAAMVLRPGRLLALFWNFAEFPQDERNAVDTAYRTAAPELSDESVVRGGGPATVPPHVETIDASGLFGPVERREYPWRRDYPRDEWLALISTYSDHATLPQERRAALLQAVGDAVDSVGGTLHAQYRTYALLARKL